MTAIDKLKALLNKKTEQEIDDEEAYLTMIGEIPKQRTTTPEAYDKMRDEEKLQFFDPHKTYDTDEAHKAINKLKALLAKEGETNSGEKSQKEDNKAKEKETETPENYDNRQFFPRIRREFYDPEDKDPY